MTDANVIILSSYRQARARRLESKDVPSAAEGLRLLRAFLKVRDFERRAEIIDRVERMSAQKGSSEGSRVR